MICVLSFAQQCTAVELTLDQKLIVACYDLQVDRVVECLRNGAHTNVPFGDSAFETDAFRDRWTGGRPHLGSNSWKALNALASSNEYPQPPAELGEMWKDRKRSLALLKRIPEEQLAKRRSDTITILQILLSHGCTLDDDDGYGATALYNAAHEGKLEMVKTLLHYGANPNTKTGVYIDGPGDETPLHVARSEKMIQLLLDHGADAFAKDSEGRTPADWLALDRDRRIDLVETPEGWRIVPRNVPAKETEPAN